MVLDQSRGDHATSGDRLSLLAAGAATTLQYKKREPRLYAVHASYLNVYLKKSRANTSGAVEAVLQASVSSLPIPAIG
jgi:hypothetical protein